MNVPPKPQPCGQPWLAMRPTTNGRLCAQCEKEIYDFSSLSWPQIVQTQAAHGNGLCGMYSDVQLAHWGHSPPSPCAPLAAAAALVLTFSTLPAPAQSVSPPVTTSDSLRLSGTVTSISAQTGKLEPLPGTTVLLVGTPFGTVTDAQGHYALTIAAPRQGVSATLSFSYIGFVPQRLALPPTSSDLVEQNAQLVLDPAGIITFSIRKPSLAERLKWRLARWFGPAQPAREAR
jgi:hypothetical protein